MQEINRYELNLKGVSYNTYYRIMRNRYVISKDGLKFREDIKNAMNNYNDKICYDCPIKLYIEFHFDDNRKRDLDNVLKSILDSLKDILYTDDSKIVELHTRKFLGCSQNKINIEISKI
jgi:Holliday junction resolvase RusA-like endonuclease